MTQRLVLLLSLFLLTSCFGERKLGQLKVENLSDTYVNIYQEDEFDFISTLYYEIVDSKGELIIAKTHLVGTNDRLKDLSNFQAKSQDSILYLLWGDEYDIFAVYDLKSGKGYPKSNLEGTWEFKLDNANDLIKQLQKVNPKLHGIWQ